MAAGAVTFDPYHKWLGIPKDQRPPTLYQLLGIGAQEQDREVIEEAAIRQSTHLRAYQLGPHAADCTRLLNEIAQARSILLHPAKRAQYDSQLRARTAAATSGITARPLPSPMQDAFADLSSHGLEAHRQRRRSDRDIAKPRGRGTALVWVLGVGGAVAVVIVIVLALMVAMSRPDPGPPPLAQGNVVPPGPRVVPEAKLNVKPEAIEPIPPDPGFKPAQAPPQARPQKPLQPPAPIPENAALRVIPLVPDWKIEVDAQPTMFETPKMNGEIVKAIGSHTLFAWSPQGRWLAVGELSRSVGVRVYDLHTGATVIDRKQQWRISTLRFTPDGKHLLVGVMEDSILRLLEIPSGRELCHYVLDRAPVAAAMLPERRLVIGMNPVRTFEGGKMNVLAPGWVRVFDAETGTLLKTTADSMSDFTQFQVSADGRQVTWNSAQQTRIWDLQGGNVIEHRLGWEPRVAPNFSQFLCKSSSSSRGVDIWDVALAGKTRTLESQSSFGRVNELNWNGSTILLAQGHMVEALDAGTGASLGFLQGHEASVRWLEIAANGRSAVTTDQVGSMRVWRLPEDLSQPRAVAVVRDHESWTMGRNTSFSVGTDGQRALVAGFGADLWNLGMSRVERTLAPAPAQPTRMPGGACAMSPDGRTAVVSLDKESQIRWFDLETGQQVAVSDDFTTPVSVLAFTPDGNYVVAVGGRSHYKNGQISGEDCGVRIYKAATRQLQATLEGHAGQIKSMAITGDSKFAYTVSHDLSVRVWDLVSRRAVRTLAHERWPFDGVTVSRDGKYVAYFTMHQPLIVRDTATGSLMPRSKDLPPSTSAIAFSPDGKYLVQGDTASGIHVVATSNWERVAAFEGARSLILRLAFDPRQAYLFATGHDGHLRRWKLPNDLGAAP